MQKKDFVSLAEARPDLAAEWNYEKNGDLRPEDVAYKSNKKVWWKLPYDVPTDYKVEKLRGKHFEFEWTERINNRNRDKKHGCPYLSGNAVWTGFNDLQTVNPELATQWHCIKNGNLKPTEVTANSKRKVWWFLQYDVPDDYPVESLRKKHFDFEWEADIASRNRGNGCPYLSSKAVYEGFNDLQTVNPELAKQWHPTKNGNLKPTQITAGTNRKVWWFLPYDDSNTGKHFDFEWQSTVASRNSGIECPFLNGKSVWKNFNDLQTTNPELAKQWHSTKNGNLKPTQVTMNSHRKVWWRLSYDVPMNYKIESLRGRHFDFEWRASIAKRNSGHSCPYLSGQAVYAGFNDLQTVSPKLAKLWHPTKNKNLKPNQVTSNSTKIVWWLFPYDDPRTGKHFDFEWKASIVSQNNNKKHCPYLSNQAIWKGFNDLQTLNQELAKQWHPTKNGNLKPTDVTAGSGKKVWWFLSYNDYRTDFCYNFEWQAFINNRNKGAGCPYLTIYKGEEYIKQYLQKNNITFTQQQKFHNLIGTGGGQLSYDFSIPSKKYGHVLIEYNGIQHYESSEFFGGDEQLKKQKEHDKLKKEYAKKHGYKLIVVKYTYDTYEDVTEYLEKELKKSDESVFDEIKGEDIKIAEKEAIEELTEEDKEKIGKRREEAGENIVCNKKENVA